MGRVIVVTSGKGGVGKTTTTANIGTALAAKGKNVLLVDLDLGLRNLDVIMGMENRIVFDIVDVVESKCRLRQAIVKDKYSEKLSLLPASQSKDKTAITEKQIVQLMDELRELYDFVIIDCPAGIEQGFKNAIAGADEAIIVVVPEVSSVRDSDRVMGLLHSTNVNTTHLVVNRLRNDMVRRGDMLSIGDVEDILGQKVTGVVPEDDFIVRASNFGEPVVNMQKSAASTAFSAIASRLLGEEVPLNTSMFKNSIREVLSRILGFERVG